MGPFRYPQPTHTQFGDSFVDGGDGVSKCASVGCAHNIKHASAKTFNLGLGTSDLRMVATVNRAARMSGDAASNHLGTNGNSGVDSLIHLFTIHSTPIIGI
jgi:hypothetical protein